ncbi:MAG: gliding motility-associated C-terminal domain-containing protein [Crocinitomicaceae bacterium]|nr:gliding motility-associated C-terminal domain-containing protein [Crocinitomicaceae bacterium]
MFRFEMVTKFKVFAFSVFIGLGFSGMTQCPGACGPNVVNNPSFEVMTANCNSSGSELFTDYTQAQGWFGTACQTCPGNGSTPDYYNSACDSAAATENCGIGTGSLGFFTSVDVGGSLGSNAREYVQSQLSTTLVAGQEYCVTAQVKTSPQSFSYVPSDGLGFWFTDNMVDIDVDNGGQQFLGPGSLVNATPQVANPSGNIIGTTCTTVSGTFVATGNEDWIVIGNFRPDNAMQTTASCGGLFTFCFGYLIIDEIEVVPVCSSCDATISAAGPFCPSDAPVNLTAVDPGGTWSGTGITDANLGTFDPSVAGVGTHSIIYDLPCGDDDTIDIVVNAPDDASFNYTPTSYCVNGTDPTPVVTGLPGGTFSIDNSGVINASTGTIDLDASGIGTYQVTYQTSGTCPQSSSVTITISNAFDATINAAGPFCETDAAVNLTAADAGGVWSGTGITDANLGTFDPSVAGAGTHTITYTISGTCGDTDNTTITVNPSDDPTFSYPSNAYCVSDPDPVATVTGTPGGTFSIDNSGVINASTGTIDLDATGAGTYQVTYQTSGTCPQSSSVTITISNAFDATINAAGPFCETDAAVNLTAADAGGVWSGTGITDANLGTFDPAVAGAGTHTITYTISGSCGDTDNTTITVNPSDDATFSYPANSYCISDPDPVATIIGTPGGTFTIDNSGVINASTGTVDLDATGAGTYQVTYQTSGTCPQSSSVTITISNAFDATINGAGPFCGTDAAVNLTAADGGGVWSGNGITDPNLGTFDPSVAGIGNHTITYTISGSCGDADSIDIVVDNNTVASLQGSHYMDYGSSVTLNASGGGTYFWSPDSYLSCSDCSSPEASPPNTTVYCVTVSNGSCPDTVCTTVYVNLDIDCNLPQIPTAFSPNSGDINSTLCVLGGCITDMNLRIYDRWGELVFESNDQAVCWDGNHMKNGKPMSTGVYVYTLTGTSFTGEPLDLKGNITLIR